MNLRDLQYLVALADHRHFGKAASASFVSQPTLSMQVKKLEKELGVELVERNRGQILLTEAGEAVVERARVILGEVDDINRIATQATDPESGSLRLGLFPTLAPYLLPHVVPTIHERFPHLELLLVEEKTAVVHASLRDGSLDAGLMALPEPDDLLHVEPLFEEDALSRLYELSNGVPRQVARLADYTLLAGAAAGAEAIDAEIVEAASEEIAWPASAAAY